MTSAQHNAFPAGRWTGYKAIEAKENNKAIKLNKYNDPIEPAREDISIAEVRDIAREDPGLIWATVPAGTDIVEE